MVKKCTLYDLTIFKSIETCFLFFFLDFISFFKKIFIIYDRHREREAETQEEGEAGSMQGPDVGLDPGSPGSHPGLQAALNCCATGAALISTLK